MTLSLPADAEPYVEDFAELRGPAVYALDLTRPDDLAAAWDDEYDTRPEWFEEFRAAEGVVYVGATADLLGRLTDHKLGEKRQTVLLSVCAVDGVRNVWPMDTADEAFERESAIAIRLRNHLEGYYVHQR